jgi:hypothetical protein
MRFLPQRPLFRRLVVSVMIVSLLLFGVSCWLIGYKNSLDRRIDAIRAEGYPATIADLAPPMVEAEEDAAAQLAAVGEQLKGFDRELAGFERTPAGKSYREVRERDETPTTEQLDAMRAIVQKFPELEAALKRAAACDQYASRLAYRLPYPQFQAAMISDLSNLRTVARYVAWQMQLAVAEGRIDFAVEQGIALLRLAELYDSSEPGVISSQIAMAVRGMAVSELYSALAAGPITPELRQKLDGELSRFDAKKSLLHALATERAISVSATQDQLGGGVKPLIVSTIGLHLKKMYVEAIDYYGPVLSVIEQPWYVANQHGTSIFKKPTAYGTMADLLAPAFEAQFAAVHRTSALYRSLRVHNALQQYAAEQGAEATSLDDLRLPTEAIEDPFTGKPLIAKPVDGKWLVYSVGKDGVDDGGEFAENKDVGFGPLKGQPATLETEE